MIRQMILHSIIGITVVVAAAVTDMGKAEYSINRILPVRNRRCRENDSYLFESTPPPASS